MASFVVDGLVVPVSVGGHSVLDFCNTRAGWGAATPKEYLHTHAHLSVWARENGLVSAAQAARLTLAADADPGAAATVLARALVLRSALYAVLTGGGSPSRWDEVNREVHAAAVALTMAAGRPATWVIGDQSGVDLPLLAVSWAAAGLLTSPASATVGACPGAGCGWLFADPRGRRRWCSMAWCGNRNKVRRHTERQQIERLQTESQQTERDGRGRDATPPGTD